MDRMKDYKQFLKQLPNNTFVCALGEFNPPTTAHELLVKTVQVVAEQRSADHAIYTSPSELISEEKKSNFLQLMFPKTKFQSLGESFFSAQVKQLSERYRKVVIIAGADQFAEFKKLKECANVEIISIGDKDPDADHPKMKQYATKGVYEDFKKLLPSTIRDIDGRRLMNEMRSGMNLEPIKEQLVFVKDRLREKYFKGEIFNEGELVESNGKQYTIVKRGSNHLLLKEESGELVSKWIHDVKPSKLKEGAIQPNGTDKIEPNAPESDTGAKQEPLPKGKTKGFLTFYNMNTKDNGNAMQEEVSVAPSSGDDAAQKAKAKAAMIMKHAKEKESLKTRHDREKHSLSETSQLDELSSDLLGRYKKKASDAATEADKKGDFKTGDKRYSGIVKATTKQFANDMKKYQKEEVEQIDEISSELAQKVSGARFKQVMADPKNPEAHAKFKKASDSALKRISHDMIKDPEKTNKGFTSDADKNTKRGWSNESVELEEAKKKKVIDHTQTPSVAPAMATTFDPFFKEEEEFDLTDEEIDSMVESVTDEEIEELYEEHEIALVYEDTGEEVEPHPEEYKMDLMEVLSRQERLKGKMRLRKTAAKRSRSTKIALKRYSDPKTVNKRARRLAIKLMKKRMLRGRDPSKVSVGEKERIEKTLAARKDVINRVAQKLVTRVRKVEKARMSHGKVTKGAMPSVF